MITLGPWCKEDLNRLMPWIDKIWALHPYFPELMGKERTLQGAELMKWQRFFYLDSHQGLIELSDGEQDEKGLPMPVKGVFSQV